MVRNFSSLPTGSSALTYDLFFSAGITPHTVAGGTTAPSKKFSAFNINKKFMEQNSSTPGTSQIPSSSSSSSKIVSTTGTFCTVRVSGRF
jgi:hypothetical protein